MESVKEASTALAGSGQYLTFFVAGEEYAVNILKVKEIVQYETVTTVPNNAPWIRGVINLRGNVVPVIDLAVKFGLTRSQATKFSCIVITEVSFQGEGITLGIMADSVNQVVDFTAKDIETPPPFGTRVRIEYLLGMGAMGKKFCLILDIDKVLSAEELVAASDSTRPAVNVSTPATPKKQSRSAGAWFR